MTCQVYEHLKKDYKEGFRCIHTEILNDSYIMQLKNFDTEKIKMLTTANPYEISRIKRYLDRLDEIKAKARHTC